MPSTQRATQNSTMVAVVRGLFEREVLEAGQRVPGEGGCSRDDPGGYGEAQDPAEEPCPVPTGVRREREEERRDPDGERADDREVAGEEREGELCHTDRQRQQGDVHGLGEEEVGHPLDVGDDPPSLGHHGRERGEGVVEEDEARHRAGGGRPGSHRHADVGVLQGQDVVHAVAGHRDDVAAALQRVHHGPLLVRRHPTEHGALLEQVGELLGVVGQRAGVDRVAGQRHPHLAGDGPRPSADGRRR